MSGLNWSKNADRMRMQRQGVEDGAETPSKDVLRRQADALLAGYTGAVTKVPATGNISSQPTFRSNRKVQITIPKSRKSNGYRARNDLFGTALRSVPKQNGFERAVPPGLVIYCDGACEPNPGAGGWGFVVYRDGTEIHADCGGADPTTNNIMELTGALRALEWIAKHASGQNARLFCDSQYVVNGCNDWRHGWKARGWRRKGKSPDIANLDLWKELDAVLIAVPITLEWCKGHVGIVGNERADELSLEGRESILALQPEPMDLIREQLDYSARGGV